MSLLAIYTYNTNHFTTAEFICASILALIPGLHAQLLWQTLGMEAWEWSYEHQYVVWRKL